jgi:hypothetical protein
VLFDVAFMTTITDFQERGPKKIVERHWRGGRNSAK